jgi:nucleotide-binding universal stress UspA family protein
MYNKILVPLDGSELAEVPLNYATHLVQRSRAEVILLHVCGPPECHCDLERCYIQPMHAVYIEHTAEVLRGRLKEAGAEEVKVSPVIRAGDPATEILSYVEENDISLIVMATHGYSGMKRWIMGSVTIKIHRCSAAPVRLVRTLSFDEAAPEDWPEKKILVLLDGSERAEQALPYVIDHARMSNSEVTLLRIYEPPTIPSDYPADMPLSWEEHVEQVTAHQREQCSFYLEGIKKRLEDDGLKVHSECILSDNAAEDIITYAAISRPNLIAMTTHARCALSVWPIGSTADKVIHGTSNPILLVRPR